jgi:PTS system fructose-specific IIC component
MIGSAVGAAMSMTMGVTMPAPHGGIFVVPLSGSPFVFLAAIVVGSLVTAALATVLKPDYEEGVGSTEGTDTGATAAAGD